MKKKQIAIYLLKILCLTLVYYLAARLGLRMAYVQQNTSPVWPPAGIALAALLLFGYRMWPGVFLGVLLGYFDGGSPLGNHLGIAIGNSLEALLGAWILRNWIGFHNGVDRVRDVLGLSLAAAVCTLVSATVGTSMVILSGQQLPVTYGTVWFTWWIGDLIGVLVFTPIILVWAQGSYLKWKMGRWLEGAAGMGLLAGVTWMFFGPLPQPTYTDTALIYLVFPFIIWAALRLAQPGATLAVLVISVVAILGTTQGRGPFFRTSLNESLLLLQTFLGVAALTAMTLAAAVEERRRAVFLLHQRINDLAALNDASKTFLASFENEENTYQAICRVAVERFDAAAAWLGLPAPDGEGLHHGGLTGISEKDLEGLLLRKSPNFLEEERAAQRSMQVSVVPLARDGGSPANYRSVACFPLNLGGKAIGVMNLLTRDSDFFSTEQIFLLQSYANLASSAIQSNRLFNQSQAANEQLHALSQRLIEIQEAERLHLSRELHDESGQALATLMVQLGLLDRDADDAELVHRHAAELKQTAYEALNNLHQLAMDLRPASLDHIGLVSALQQLTDDFRQKHRLDIEFEVVGLNEERLPPEVETSIFRIVQESLTNVVLHARATRADVILSRRGSRLAAVVEDDGVGFDSSEIGWQNRLGLFGMQERVQMLGGTLTIESAAGKGTTVAVEVPCENNSPDSG